MGRRRDVVGPGPGGIRRRNGAGRSPVRRSSVAYPVEWGSSSCCATGSSQRGAVIPRRLNASRHGLENDRESNARTSREPVQAEDATGSQASRGFRWPPRIRGPSGGADMCGPRMLRPRGGRQSEPGGICHLLSFAQRWRQARRRQLTSHIRSFARSAMVLDLASSDTSHTLDMRWCSGPSSLTTRVPSFGPWARVKRGGVTALGRRRWREVIRSIPRARLAVGDV